MNKFERAKAAANEKRCEAKIKNDFDAEQALSLTCVAIDLVSTLVEKINELHITMDEIKSAGNLSAIDGMDILTEILRTGKDPNHDKEIDERMENNLIALASIDILKHIYELKTKMT